MNKIECPYCHGGITVSLHEVTLGSQNRSMYSCKKCEGCWLPDPFNPAQIQAHYENCYFSGSEREIYKGKVLARDYLKKVEKICFIEKGARILEIGAGFGFFANYISIKHSTPVDILEPNEASKQFINIKHPNVKVIGSTLNDLPNENKYDYIFCFHVLEHLTDIKKFLKQVSNHLSESGKVFCLTPNSLSKSFKRYGTQWGWIGLDQHYSFISEDVPNTFFHDAGLNVEVKRSFVPAPLHFPSVWRIKASEIYSRHISIRSTPLKSNSIFYKVCRKIVHVPNFLIGKIAKYLEPFLAADSKGAKLLYLEAFFAEMTPSKQRDELCLVLSIKK